MIQIEHLTKTFYSGEKAVDDISLHVKTGEVFGFLGPNGAGKTTTIKILTTLLRPTSGTAKVAGHDVVDDPLAVRMAFGYVGQKSGVDPAFTVSENLLLQARLYHLASKKIKERIKTLLDLFEMGDRAGQWVGSLSGGLKRRLDIATALIHAPKLLFLDEPTLGLDPKSRSDLWTYLRKINQEEGVTLFLTTHYLEEVDQLADRVGILDAGRIRIIGTPNALKDSLGADVIQLTFDAAPAKDRLNQFRARGWFKEVTAQGSEIRLYLEKGRESLAKVVQWVDEIGLKPHSIHLARPSFDDVYLKYTGKSWALSEINAEEGWGEWGGGKNNKWAKNWEQKNASASAKREEGAESAQDGSEKAWSGNEWSGNEGSDKQWPNEQKAHSPENADAEAKPSRDEASEEEWSGNQWSDGPDKPSGSSWPNEEKSRSPKQW